MKRIVACVLSACLILPLFSGCGGADTTPAQPGEFTAPPAGSASSGEMDRAAKKDASSKVGAAAAPAE